MILRGGYRDPAGSIERPHLDVATRPDHPAPQALAQRPWRIGLIVAVLAVTISGCQRLPHLQQLFERHVAGPSLEGTYRLIYDGAKGTANGQPSRVESDKVLWAFRSTCTKSNGCTATATALDRNDAKTEYRPAFTMVLHFSYGQWISMPSSVAVMHMGPCRGGGDTVVSQAPVATSEAMQLKPEADGTLTGNLSATVLSNVCGGQGLVADVPFTATRIGDVASTVNVADPDSAGPRPPKTSTLSSAFNGLYSLQANTLARTRNGFQAPTPLPYPSAWAMRAVCNTSTHCIATGALFNSFGSMPTVVLESVGEKWQTAASTIRAVPCSFGPLSTTVVIEMQVEMDNAGYSGIGTETIRVLTGECGDQGATYNTPVTLRKAGIFPPSAVVADPDLFMPS